MSDTGAEAPIGTEGTPPADAGTSDDGGSSESEATYETLNVDEYGDHRVTVKIDGEERLVPLKEALEGHMRHADYTRKTQDVAEVRQHADAYTQLNAAFQADPEATIRALAKQAGIDLGTSESSLDESESLSPEEARIRELEQFVQSETERRNREHLDSTMNGLKDKYGDALDEAELTEYAVKRGFTVDTLEDAFRAMHYDKAIEEARAAAKSEQEQGEQDRQSAKEGLPPIHGGSANGGPVRQGDRQVRNIRDALALAREQLKL